MDSNTPAFCSNGNPGSGMVIAAVRSVDASPLLEVAAGVVTGSPPKRTAAS